MNRQRSSTAWHLNQPTIQTYTSVLVSMQIIAHAATWKRTTLHLVQQANALPDPEVVGVSCLFLIWSQQGSVIAAEHKLLLQFDIPCSIAKYCSSFMHQWIILDAPLPKFVLMTPSPLHHPNIIR